MTREVRLTSEGQEIESGEFEDDAIAQHFGLVTPAQEAAIKQICEWADEEGCAQGYAIGEASSLVVEPT